MFIGDASKACCPAYVSDAPREETQTKEQAFYHTCPALKAADDKGVVQIQQMAQVELSQSYKTETESTDTRSETNTSQDGSAENFALFFFVKYIEACCMSATPLGCEGV